MEQLHSFEEEAESLRDEPFLVGHFKAIELDNLEFGKLNSPICVLLKYNEENEEMFYIEAFTDLGIWNEIPVHEDEKIPHPLVQHIAGLILDHVPDDTQFQRVVREKFLENLRTTYKCAYSHSCSPKTLRERNKSSFSRKHGSSFLRVNQVCM